MAKTILGGAIGVADTLAALKATNNSLLPINEQEVFQEFDKAYTAHNRLTTEMIDSFCEVTTKRNSSPGGWSSAEMDLLDENGFATPTNYQNYGVIGFPLIAWGKKVAWNRIALKNVSIGEMAKQVEQIFIADLRMIQKQIKSALMLSSNYTFNDYRVDGYALPVKRLQNNDSSVPVPVSPTGTTFATTHTHYLAATSLTTTSLNALIDTLTEHIDSGSIVVEINSAQEATMVALTGFSAVQYSYLTQSTAADHIDNAKFSLDPLNTTSRLIGFYRGAQIWVKPWTVANYLIGRVVGNPTGKPLAVRVRGAGTNGEDMINTSIITGGDGLGNGDLQMLYEVDEHPMYAKTFEREIGFGVKNRLAAAVLYIAGSSYVDPTL